MGENGTNGQSEEQTSNSPAEHLKPFWFKPGQSGNPKGRPKRKTFAETFYELLKEPCPADPKLTNLQALGRVAIAKALKGDIRFLTLIVERVEGKPLQPLILDGDITVEQKYDLSRLTDDELADLARLRLRLADRGAADRDGDRRGTGAA